MPAKTVKQAFGCENYDHGKLFTLAKGGNCAEFDEDSVGHSLTLINEFLGRAHDVTVGFDQATTAGPHLIQTKGIGDPTKLNPQKAPTITVPRSAYATVFTRRWTADVRPSNLKGSPTDKAKKGTLIVISVRGRDAEDRFFAKLRFGVSGIVTLPNIRLEHTLTQGGQQDQAQWERNIAIFFNVEDSVLDAALKRAKCSLVPGTDWIDLSVECNWTLQADDGEHEAGFVHDCFCPMSIYGTTKTAGVRYWLPNYRDLNKSRNLAVGVEAAKIAGPTPEVVSSLETEAEFTISHADESIQGKMEMVLNQFIADLWTTATLSEGDQARMTALHDHLPEGLLQPGAEESVLPGDLADALGPLGWKFLHHVPKYWRGFETAPAALDKAQKQEKAEATEEQKAAAKAKALREANEKAAQALALKNKDKPRDQQEALIAVTEEQLTEEDINACLTVETNAPTALELTIWDGTKPAKVKIMAPWRLTDYYFDSSDCLLFRNAGSVRLRCNARGWDLLNVKSLPAKLDDAATVRFCANIQLANPANLAPDDPKYAAAISAVLKDRKTIAVAEGVEAILRPPFGAAVTRTVQRSGTKLVKNTTVIAQGAYAAFFGTPPKDVVAFKQLLTVKSTRCRFSFGGPASVELSFDVSEAFAADGSGVSRKVGLEFGLDHAGVGASDDSHVVGGQLWEDAPRLAPESAPVSAQPKKKVGGPPPPPEGKTLDFRLYDPYDLSHPNVSDPYKPRSTEFIKLRDAVLGCLAERFAAAGIAETDGLYQGYFQVAGFKANSFAAELLYGKEPLDRRTKPTDGWPEARALVNEGKTPWILPRPVNLAEETTLLKTFG